MTRTLTALLLAFALAATPGALLAQGKLEESADVQAMRAAVKADKRGYIEGQLQLTEKEAKKFWPAYDAYQRSLDSYRRRLALVVEQLVAQERPLTDAQAKEVATALVAADEAELKARRTLHNRVMRALPAKKGARYLQIEAKIRAFYAHDLAVTLPLVK